MKRLKILLYGDQNLNIMDGSAIWLTSLANILNYDDTVDLTILLKTPIKRRHVIENITKIDNVNLINPFESGYKIKSKEKMSPYDASALIQTLDSNNNYDIIITRGKDVTRNCLEQNFYSKLIPYITDFNVNEENDLLLLGEIYKSCLSVFVQTGAMKELLKDKIHVSGDKFILLPPTVENRYEQPSIGIKNYSIVYTGKFAKMWETEAMVNSFIEAKKSIDALSLNIAGDKFQKDLLEQKDDLQYKFENISGMYWIGAVSRDKSLELIRNSDLGYAYRSSNIDNNDSVELSTKFLEFGINGKPALIRKTKQYIDLLGEDYPLYCNSYEELVTKIKQAFTVSDVYNKAAKRCYEASKDYQISKVSKSVLQHLHSFDKKKKTILFAGHDFKFLNWYIEHVKSQKEYNVLIDKWEGHSSHDYEKSKELLMKADIIFCEWGLGNAEFYSNNKLRGQSLYIRVHRQELTTKFLDNVNYKNVTKIITISAHAYEEFNRIKKIPRSKMIIIANMVDIKRFNTKKNMNINYNIGLLGYVPMLKRPDRALTILERLYSIDNRFKLFIKGRHPKELAWLKNRQDEWEYYETLFYKLKNSTWSDNVIIEPHGEDVAEWFKNITFILSTSEIESFHLAPMEGMASGSIPIVFNWPGAETLYPLDNIVKSEEEAVRLICQHVENIENRNPPPIDYTKRVGKYDKSIIIDQLDKLIF